MPGCGVEEDVGDCMRTFFVGFLGVADGITATKLLKVLCWRRETSAAVRTSIYILP
jgi:hypothetical protein